MRLFGTKMRSGMALPRVSSSFTQIVCFRLMWITLSGSGVGVVGMPFGSWITSPGRHVSYSWSRRV